MSAQQEETRAPVSQPNQDVSGSDDGSAGSPSRNTALAHKVYARHGLLLSSIELALTVSNAVNQDAFQFKYFSGVIFGGSAVIEAVGFAFAIAMALRFMLYPVKQGVIGVGAPAMVIAEVLAGPGSEADMVNLCYVGLGAQSLSFFIFWVISWSKSPASVPTLSDGWWIVIAVVTCGFLLYVWQACCHPRYFKTKCICYIFLVVPFVVEIAESAFLFTSDSIAFVAYLLAVLDLVIIAPAAIVFIRAVAILLNELVHLNFRTLIPNVGGVVH